MSRRSLALSVAAVALTACAGGDSTAPTTRDLRDASLRTPTTLSASGGSTGKAAAQPLSCSVPTDLAGTAVIGASGGTLYVGAHRLIVPPGALKQSVTISGFVPHGTSVKMQLFPEGLEFKKTATLILDLGGCVAPSSAVFVDYLNSSGQVQQRIQTLFSTWFNFIAAPIEHFSIYALDV
jgi:hypothetical protein